MSAQDFDALHARGKSLEDAYFAERDRQLVEKLRSELNDAEKKRLLAVTLGLTEHEMAHLAPGLDVPPTIAILPLVQVAWCDGQVSSAEKNAILKATVDLGVQKDHPFYIFLHNWLDQQPSAAALDLWKIYVRELTAKVGPVLSIKIQDGIMGRAEKIAAAAGGILGFNAISDVERKCLHELNAAFAS